MLVFDWLRRDRRPSRPHPQPTRRRRYTPAVEALEDRTLLSVDLVSKAFPIDVEVTDSVISADGRLVAFTSPTSDVIPGQVDTNNRSDVFLFDRDTGVTTLISHTGDGFTTGNDTSMNPVISADGSSIAFESYATDLVAGSDMNGTIDVFAWTGGVVTLISHSTSGATTAGNRFSGAPVISADGSTIAFESAATDLVAGFVDNNSGQRDVFVSTEGVVTFISHSSAGPTTTGNSTSFGPVLSADGEVIAFTSEATDLVAGLVDANGIGPNGRDVFAYSGGVVTLISRSTAGATITGNYQSHNPSITADGGKIAFQSLATDLVSGFVNTNGDDYGIGHDVFASAGGVVTLISHSTDGATTSGNGGSNSPAISADGSTIVFHSQALDLVTGFVSNNPGGANVFASNRGVVTLISHSTDGPSIGGNGASFAPLISADGSTVTFTSRATNLVAGMIDINGGGLTGRDVFSSNTGVLTLISHSIAGAMTTGNRESFDPAMSADGGTLVYASAATDLVVSGPLSAAHRLFASQVGTTSLVPEPGVTANDDSSLSSSANFKFKISDDSRFVVFQSKATNLVAGQIDKNGADDVFHLDRITGEIRLISHTGDGVTTGNRFSYNPEISGDGSTIVFESAATDLVAGFVNNNGSSRDIFAWRGGVVSLISHSTAGATTSGNGLSFAPAISSDGSTIAFQSSSTDLVAGTDQNGTFDIFASKDGLVTLISHSTAGATTTSNGYSHDPVISADGSTIAFVSNATDLVANFVDQNGSELTESDVFAWRGGVVALISHSSAGSTTGGNGVSYATVISADGGTIVFISDASNLVVGADANSGVDVFASTGGVVKLISHSIVSPTTTGNSSSGPAVISADGNTIAFVSRASDLVDGMDSNSTQDVFVSRGGEVTLISHSTAGPEIAGNTFSYAPVLSADGTTVAFQSFARDLVDGFVNVNGNSDVFASRGGVITLISYSIAGPATAGNGRSIHPVINADGSAIVFESIASDLVPNDNNDAFDIFFSEPAFNQIPNVGDQSFLISEHIFNGDTVGTVVATDPNAGQTLTFAITGGNTGGGFAINPLTGEITVANAGLLDHETIPQFLLTVEVTDNGTPQLSDTATITIDVLDVNEPPTVEDQQFSVSEDAQPQDVVGTVPADDPDNGQAVTFSIIGGNVGGAFAIHPTSGVIGVADPEALDYDVMPQFLLSVLVSDGQSPALTDMGTVTINITEGLPTDAVYVNDDFTQPDGTVIVDADPNTAGDQSAIAGVNAFADLQDALNAVDAGGHVRVTDDLASDGPGMYAGALIINRNVTIESTEGDRTAVAIDGGNATRVATIAGGANVVISGVTLQNGRVLSGSGGGLGILNGASVTLTSVDVLASSAEFGGGIFVDEATIVLNDTRVSGNIAGTDGGGIFNFGGVTINGGRIEDNTSGPRGGGVSLSQDGSTLAVDGTTFEGNSAEQGGGLYIGGLITGTHSIANATFQANHATSGNGGAIFIVGGDLLEVTDTLISSNTASSVGGGIYSISTAVKLMRSTLSNNSAGLNGGGAAVNGTGHRLDLLDTRVEQNTAGRQGGGLWNGSASILVLTAASQVTGNRASGDTHSGGGGGIYNNGGRLALAGGVLVELNVADGDAGAGGGIFTINGVVTLSESTVRGNTATRAGGGVEFFTGILELTNSQVEDNAATGGGADAPGDGGGIHVLGLAGQVGRINIIGGSVSGNTAARQGGGLWNQQGNIMVVRGGAVVDGNTASGDAAEDGGGGIFNRGGRLAVGEGVVISNNVADGDAGSGGGIFSTGSGVSIAGGTVISGNSANRAGGGIEVIDGLLTINDSTIENNDAGITGTANPGHGGGVHVTGTNFTRVDLWNSIVRNNSAAGQGGGLWNQTNGVMLVRVGSQVTGNTASGDAADDGGGGIYNQGGRLIIHNATIDGNIADGTAGSGGGVFTRDWIVTVENATISNNTAHRAGGGVEIVDGWFFTRNMNLTGNNAGGTAPNPGDGGGLHVTGTNLSRVRIDGGTIADNAASGSGGGLWHQAGSLMVIFGGTTIDGNTAAGDAVDAGGGGIFNAGGRLAITEATLSGNSASGTNGAGGGILSLGGGLTLDNSTVSGNQANADGGGVVSNGEFIAANATIVANRSDADGVGGGSGGGLLNGGLATINNTIVAGNLVGAGSAASDLAGSNLRAASAHNIVGHAGSAGGLTEGTNGNIVGNAGIGVLALATIVNPTLASNGGPTLTHALAQNSPAIDAGSNNLAKDAVGMAFTTDQRGIGFPRIVGGTVDIGAVEA